MSSSSLNGCKPKQRGIPSASESRRQGIDSRFKRHERWCRSSTPEKWFSNSERPRHLLHIELPPSATSRTESHYQPHFGAPSACCSTSSRSRSSSAALASSGYRPIPRLAARSLSRPAAGVPIGGRTGLQLAGHAVEPGGDDRSEGEVRVVARIARLELQVGRPDLVAPIARRNADGRFAIFDTPCRVRRAPVVRLQAAEGVDGRRGEGEQRGQVPQDARDRSACEPAEPFRSWRPSALFVL